MKRIDNVWIVKEGAGLCLFSYPEDEEVDEQIVAGFMQAIKCMTGKINGMNFIKKTITITYDDELNVFFIVRSSRKASKAARKCIKKIKKRFQKQYKHEMKDWKCDTKIFENFIPSIVEFVKK